MGIYFVFFLPPAKRKKKPHPQTAHLQIAIADTQTKFAKELFLPTHQSRVEKLYLKLQVFMTVYEIT